MVEQHTAEVFESDGWLGLSEATLCEVLASDKLSVPEELALYRAVVRWGGSAGDAGWSPRW